MESKGIDELVRPIIFSVCHFSLNNNLYLLENMQFSFENIELYDDKVFELYICLKSRNYQIYAMSRRKAYTNQNAILLMLYIDYLN